MKVNISVDDLIFYEGDSSFYDLSPRPWKFGMVGAFNGNARGPDNDLFVVIDYNPETQTIKAIFPRMRFTIKPDQVELYLKVDAPEDPNAAHNYAASLGLCDYNYPNPQECIREQFQEKEREFTCHICGDCDECKFLSVYDKMANFSTAGEKCRDFYRDQELLYQKLAAEGKKICRRPFYRKQIKICSINAKSQRQRKKLLRK